MSTATSTWIAKSGSFLAGQRLTPPHGFTPATISAKRLRENTTSLAITVGLILPTLTAVNQRLEKHVNDGTDVPLEEIVSIFVKSAKESGKRYADRLARVSIQTAFASVLIRIGKPTADSMVYLWDLYPRLMQRYVGEVFSLLHIPRFFASLLGPAPSASDVAYLKSSANAVDAFGASLKRNTVFLVGDVVVDTALGAVDPAVPARDRPSFIAKRILARATAVVCWATGAALGRAVAGERGEYWGEYMGTVAAPVVSLQVLLLVSMAKSTNRSSNGLRRPSSSSGKSRSRDARSNSKGSREPSAAVEK